jgi:hypothetical protein
LNNTVSNTFIHNTYDLKNTTRRQGWMAMDRWNRTSDGSWRTKLWQQQRCRVTCVHELCNDGVQKRKKLLLLFLKWRVSKFTNCKSQRQGNNVKSERKILKLLFVCVWVCNRWKTNLYFFPVLTTMERLSFLLATKYKRLRWLGLVWWRWWWCRRILK